MINIQKLKEDQIKLAKKISHTDQFEKIETIAGVDYIYTEKEIICAIAILNYKTLEIIEKKYAVEKQNFPYIPGFLSYRVAAVTIRAFEMIEEKPDIMMISANGILHPRKIGAASVFGLTNDITTIGVSKKKLCGEEIDDAVYIDKEIIGKKIVTKEKAKPVYVSPGHKISLKTTLEVVKKMLKGHKLPEPLYLAHKYGNKVKAKLKEKDTSE
jgi:deoxyribonuclease V